MPFHLRACDRHATVGDGQAIPQRLIRSIMAREIYSVTSDASPVFKLAVTVDPTLPRLTGRREPRCRARLNIEDQEQVLRADPQILDRLVRLIRYKQRVEPGPFCPLRVPPEPQDIFIHPSPFRVCELKTNVHPISGMGVCVFNRRSTILDNVESNRMI